ncbi:M56 family metallopeptidase [Mucilaginibacter sp. PAMB04168]|uniref:M56 family metallopeptidase n=1 Tax=Mucilaginibacter sp. PAMB04168 TaxID=3138567 RepID=UPI0031F681A9
MKTVIYLLEASACTGLFYSFYFLFLRRLTFFTLNRWYLLVTLLLSFVIPKLQMPVEAPNVNVLKPVMYIQQMQRLEVNSLHINHKVVYEPGVAWVMVIKALYFTGALLLSIRLMIVLVIFCRKLNGKRLAQLGFVTVMQGDKSFGNSSFLNVVFINDEELDANEVKQILSHELLHVKLLHSVDRIIAWLARIVLWFNPFVYGYLRSIEENHEFEVDRIAAGNDEKGKYASLLLKLTVANQATIFQGFSKAPLKKRIYMLFNQPTSNMKKVIYVLVLPMVVISCLAFARFEHVQVNHKLNLKLSDGKRLRPDSVNPYRQKVKRTPGQIKGHAAFIAWTKSADYQAKVRAAEKLKNEIGTFKVVGSITSDNVFIKQGTLIQRDGKNYILGDNFGRDKDVHALLKPGDVIDIKPSSVLYGKNGPLVIQASFIKRDNVIIYEAKPEPAPDYAFLYEANRVRFADGVLTNVDRYPNGKWKTAIIAVNGYQIKFNVKPSAPEFDDIAQGDHVRFRFVHEVKTGAKEYTVNDWISISADVKDYGIKNPDFFFKFYEKI